MWRRPAAADRRVLLPASTASTLGTITASLVDVHPNTTGEATIEAGTVAVRADDGRMARLL